MVRLIIPQMVEGDWWGNIGVMPACGGGYLTTIAPDLRG